MGSHSEESSGNIWSKSSAWEPHKMFWPCCSWRRTSPLTKRGPECHAAVSGFKELMRILTSPSLALLSLLLLPLPVPPGLPRSSALCCSTTHSPLCTWEEWIFNEPIISVRSTHRNTVTTCTINTKGIWLTAKYKITVVLSALHDLGLCPARCGILQDVGHLSQWNISQD